jgi:hypothetical protein
MSIKVVDNDKMESNNMAVKDARASENHKALVRLQWGDESTLFLSPCVVLPERARVIFLVN